MTVRVTEPIRSSEAENPGAACVVNFPAGHMEDISINTDDYRSGGNSGVTSDMHAHSLVQDIKVISETLITTDLQNV